MDTTNHVLLEYEISDWGHLDDLKDMLTISEEGSEIYICHPGHVLDSIVENPTTKDVIAVDFDSINVQRMLDNNDFGHYSRVGAISCKNDGQVTYLLKRAQCMLKEYSESGIFHYSCPFAVIEKLDSGTSEPKYLVRGIVSCRQNSFSIASNTLAMRKDSDDKSKNATL